MEDNKIKFLKNQFIPLFASLDAKTKGQWGILNAQQVVEHLSKSIQVASGKVKIPPVTAEEHLLKVRNFMLSDKPFKENSKNPLMRDDGDPIQHASMQEAIEELKTELNYFFAIFEKNNTLTTNNPLFGTLNFEENIHLLYKHALHHLRQFNLMV